MSKKFLFQPGNYELVVNDAHRMIIRAHFIIRRELRSNGKRVADEKLRGKYDRGRNCGRNGRTGTILWIF